MWHMYDGDFIGMHFFWWIIWIVLIVWIFATPWGNPGNRKNGHSPMDILRKRYASGEIDTKEFEERKKVLEDDLKK